MLPAFHPIVTQWFTDALGTPTEAQRRGWEAIRQGRHTLIAAPTGSGKTLAAFLTAIDDLVQEGLEAPLPDEVRVVYVSPLKALSADIHRNLAIPRREIERLAQEGGLPIPRITAAVRTGDTPQAERAAMLRRPPHILVTTPESLYLLLTAERSREMLRTTRTVIVDEIHAVIGGRRGAHLALSLERLAKVAERPLLRIGLSATQKPIERVADFLVGTRAVQNPVIVNEGHHRAMDLAVEIPRSALEAVMSHEVWEEYHDRLAELIALHQTTLIFVNTRRMAERLTRHLCERLGKEAVTAHHGSLSKDKRFDAERRLKGGALKALVATASLELGIDIGHVDLVCQIGSPHRIATLLQRVGRSGHTVHGMPKGRVFPVSRDDLVECAALLRSVGSGDLDAIVFQEAPLDVLAQQLVAETSCADYAEDELFDLVRRAHPYRDLTRPNFDAVVAMASNGFSTRRGRRGSLVHRDEVNGRLRGRRGARMQAIGSGGAIPELADYKVVLEPEDIPIGTVNEDWAIESMAGDIFQLGNASWRIVQVGSGVVRVADAKGAPPTIPFWLGEAPARSDELSAAVSSLRAGVDRLLDEGSPATDWIASETGLSVAAAEQVATYLSEGRHALGAMPTQQTLVLERFFDESGGMQLVLHAPFGSRVNRAWGLALRKRFCRQFNFELQAAATDEALLLSLGPQHSFPLSDVFRYLHPATARDVLVQAMLDAPVFQTRWRWNTTISLAVPRNRSGRKVPPQLQRMLADDLMAAVFPDAAACLENIPGDREIPDHPLVSQTVHDCLTEAMDFEALASLLERIHAGELRLVARDTHEPSPFTHEILNARPYAFLDDAPLEERRTQAVYTRRASEPGAESALDQAAIDRVREEQRVDARNADELHDALLTAGVLTTSDVVHLAPELWDMLLRTKRAASAQFSSTELLVTAERLPELLALHPAAQLVPRISAPTSRSERVWTREEALVEMLRGRLTLLGPTSSAVLAATLAINEAEVDQALLTLESEGVVLRGAFTHEAAAGSEWCERSLLARIHRYTLNRLRAEIEPVSGADFMRFLFDWQHVAFSSRLAGIDGLRAVLTVLDGVEVQAAAWEGSVLPARMEHYDASLLDALCLTGEIGWGRLSAVTGQTSVPVPATPIALFLREHADAWRTLRRLDTDGRIAEPSEIVLDDTARQIVDRLREQGASFFKDLAVGCGMPEDVLRGVLGRLVGAGLVTSDGFAGLRAIVRGAERAMAAAGRWSATPQTTAVADEPAIEASAWTLLRRYGVVFRRLLTRESNPPSWRLLTRVYRRLEARGEIRGGRFVAGMPGEQFALPGAVERLREIRRTPPDGRLLSISAADPLNLAGVLDSGERVRAVAGSRLVYRDGVALAAMEGDYVRQMAPVDDAIAAEVASLLAGRRVPGILNGFLGR